MLLKRGWQGDCVLVSQRRYCQSYFAEGKG